MKHHGKPGKVAAGSSAVRQIVRTFRPGYHLRAAGHGRHAVYGPDDLPVRTETGVPIVIANNPAKAAIRGIVARLRKAGVID